MSEDPGGAAYLVREPGAADVEAFAELHVRIWRETYRGIMDDRVVDGLAVETFRPRWYAIARAYEHGTVADDGRAVRVALREEEAVGFAMVGPARDDDAPAPRQVWSLNVAPEHQGSGVAQQLLDEVLPDGPAYLWVARGNDRAIRFYERNGFTLDGTQAEDQHDGVVELRMVRR
ncbi:GNAT family N-acetyltransferase [Ornithinimicrobium cerasi]|uniref:GNAT family N-acetyltransferase n=1 Tax=Ornithinimicrobium cerasi TaxID=2248773 RepID=UPI000F005C00|nr:GNAT family N-acetyltransferase [Ornithinimicrobium cerasi]